MDAAAALLADLAERIFKGDGKAENELCVLITAGIRQTVSRRLNNFARADELTQDALIIVIRRLRKGRLKDPSRLAAFVAQTARNLAKAELRKERRRIIENVPKEQLDALPDLEQDPVVEVEMNQTAAMVHTVLQEFQGRDRLILVRWYLEDVDTPSICRELGIQESHIHVVVFRARKKLQQLLQRRGLGPNELLSILLVA